MFFYQSAGLKRLFGPMLRVLLPDFQVGTPPFPRPVDEIRFPLHVLTGSLKHDN